MTLELAWPPSVNHYYRHVGRNVVVSREGRRYRDYVIWVLKGYALKPLTGNLEVWMTFYPPDRRRRDLDNCVKCLQDALQQGGLFLDDFQIKKLHLEMADPIKNGKCFIRIEEIKDDCNQ